jgi:hypothetical protein
LADLTKQAVAAIDVGTVQTICFRATFGFFFSLEVSKVLKK